QRAQDALVRLVPTPAHDVAAGLGVAARRRPARRLEQSAELVDAHLRLRVEGPRAPAVGEQIVDGDARVGFLVLHFLHRVTSIPFGPRKCRYEPDTEWLLPQSRVFVPRQAGILGARSDPTRRRRDRIGGRRGMRGGTRQWPS